MDHHQPDKSSYNRSAMQVRVANVGCIKPQLPQPSETTSSSSPSFLPFPRLPCELREEILGLHALPKGHFVYNLYRFYIRCIEPIYANLGREFWMLRQVNREARHVVLQGRQGVVVRMVRYQEKVREILFVNWDTDLFNIPRPFDLPPPPSAHLFIESSLSKIQTMALPLRYQRDFSFPGISEPFTASCLRIMVLSLPALRCFYLTVTYETLRSVYGGQLFLLPTTALRIMEGCRFPFKVRRHDHGYVPVSFETIAAYLRASPYYRAEFDEWCPEFLRRLSHFRAKMQEAIPEIPGRIVECKTVITDPAFGPMKGEELYF
ncbi:hypothetical protein HD806DRAFT_78233 [Xylariaceae sp. AK1471]|nr:hypothetical protein HD806DRAFT_78233 [Xylariaceae sp. AK1471]